MPNEFSDDTNAAPSRGISRRTVVRTAANAAWMVPAISLVTSAPAMAVSDPPPPSGDSAFLNLNTPKYTEEPPYGNGYDVLPTQNPRVTLSGTISPAVAGRPISLYRDNSSGPATFLSTVSTDANGNFVFTASITAGTTFHFYAGAHTKGGSTYGSVASATFQVKALYFFDDFSTYANNSANMAPRWKARGNPKYNMSIKQRHSKSSLDAVKFDSTGMYLGIVADGVETTKEDGTAGDGKRRFLAPGISPGKLGIVNGSVEASIKFEKPKGAHGALWWQSGYSADGAEFDVVEFFGNRGAGTQSVSHNIYKGTTVHKGGITWTKAAASNGINFTKTNFDTSTDTSWWTKFHTYRGAWLSGGYYFYIDDILVGSIPSTPDCIPATIPGEIILSLLVSEDNEYNDLLTYIGGGGSPNDYKMYVKDIRVYR